MFALDETIEWDKALFSFMHRRCGSNYGHNSKKLMEAHRPRHNVTDPDVSATFVLFRPLSDLSRTTTTPTGNIDR
jgi:hypothetical protein